MGMWDEYCTICGGPPYVFFDDMVDGEGQPVPLPPPNPADYTWLESFIGISNKEELIPLTSYSGYGTFDIQPGTSPHNSYFIIGCRDEDYIAEDAAKGYACHVACYNLLQQELNYTLKCADVLPLLADSDYCALNSFSWSGYGGLAEYHGQSFGDGQLVKDGKLWMIEDPSRDGENKERILKLWRPLVESGFKKPEARVGDDDGRSAPEIAETNMDEPRV